MSSEDLKEKSRVIIIQILYAKNFNSESEIKFPKHRFKKFIKDVVLGSLERKELIEETISLHLNKDIDIKRTEKLIIILLHAETASWCHQLPNGLLKSKRSLLEIFVPEGGFSADSGRAKTSRKSAHDRERSQCPSF